MTATHGMERSSALALLPAYAVGCVLLSACEDGGGMRDTPRYEALEPSSFFEDGASARPLPEGVVARGSIVEDEALRTGRIDESLVARVPLEVTDGVLRRGEERFNIYCTPCHGLDGSGGE